MPAATLPAVPACPTCGVDNPDRARFCLDCGQPLGTAPAEREQPRESRRTVTVLFSDLVGSTTLGEQLDPETLRAVMGRYFATMQAVLQRHGGTVEKFIGDAIMAVFGLSELHEDDALRAVRAASEMREALAVLNQELSVDVGVTIAVRTGVHTGEVVAGDPAAGQTLVTGDAVNTAARLEQAAPTGEILLGRQTWLLVRDAVMAEPVEPIAAKGKTEPLVAMRLVAIHQPADGTQIRSIPLVGRDVELARMLAAWEQAQRHAQPSLISLVGAAGVGKSRLVAAFVDRVGENATVLRGSCLPYGEGSRSCPSPRWSTLPPASSRPTRG